MRYRLSLLFILAAAAGLFLSGCRTAPKADRRLGKYAPEVSEECCLLFYKSNRFKLHPNRQYAVFNTTPIQLPAAPFYSSEKVYSVTPMTLRNIIDPLMTGVFPTQKIRRILIDPGHGGHDAGAVGRSSREKDLNFLLALEIRNELQKAGFQVIMTRNKDIFLTLPQRVAMVKKYGADLFISVHHNSSKKNPQAAGIECFAHRTPRPEDTMLAAMIQQELIRVTNRPNRGVKFANFAVLRNNPVPAVLIEAGFISNRAEEVLLNTPQWRKRAAYAVANAVRSYALKK